MISKTTYAKAVYIFSSYAPEDSKLLKVLEKHLIALHHQGLIESWHHQDLNARSDWKSNIDAYLSRSDIILLLISPDFLASDYCYKIEMVRALEQFEAGKASVIPIILRPSSWYNLPFARLQSLPISEKEGVKPVTLWRNRDLAFVGIIEALRKVIVDFISRYSSTDNAIPSPPNDTLLLQHVPYPRNHYFTAREDVLNKIHALFHTPGSTYPISVTLSGLSGFGKTQIALEYAYRYQDDYQAVFWIKADSHENLVADVMHLADVLALPEKNGTDQQLVIAAVKHWFHNHAGWLLILDNVEQTSLLKEFIPTTGQGNILITCREQTISNTTTTIKLDTLEADAGALLLLRRARIITYDVPLQKATPSNIAQAMEIAQLVDGHPLALEQAGAYIAETHIDLASYINAYTKNSTFLLQGDDTTATDQPTSVIITFSLALQKVKSSHPAAAELLKRCAFLDPDSIPEQLLIEGIPDPDLQATGFTASTLDAATKVLLKFSLLQRNSETNSLTLHRLVQVAVKNEMDEQEQRQWAVHTVRAINRVFPAVEFEAWFLCQQYLPHALICVDLIKQWQIELTEAGHLLNETGSYLYERAQYRSALPLYELALTIREHVLGLEAPATAETLNNLGELARKQDKYVDAEQFYQRALAIREHVLGPEDPATAQTLNNLGELTQTLEQLALAETFYQRALKIREQTLGPEHPETIKSIGNLAGIYDEQGNYTQAEPLYKRALKLCEETLGPKHPDTALALSKLARFYRVQQEYAQAEPLFERALTVAEQALGPDHPDVALILNNLAFLYRVVGKYAQAEQLLKRAIAIWTLVLGAEHSNTAASLNNLARVYSEQGNYLQAEPLFQQALAIREHELGKDHPSTAQTLTNIGELYLAQNRYTEAKPLFLRALEIYRHKLGSDHPDTVATQEKYAFVQQKLLLDPQNGV